MVVVVVVVVAVGVVVIAVIGAIVTAAATGVWNQEIEPTSHPYSRTMSIPHGYYICAQIQCDKVCAFIYTDSQKIGKDSHWCKLFLHQKGRLSFLGP